ncbi:MAG TPA: type II toxin-antitoxin system RelE/ParE family toxin [Spirochaetota bacterium]|jgi:hypothetical protein|nr:MAG: hypothetical protein BWX91_02228 [Spirochaetes bacterium ADurb.Bin133]HNZ28246.1 type II toxin-antitoxin system RelE/ParE family toxin [Spirochaetota bacterium]HOF01255.1 type II toxin-antitoxin system RelE/ParE family toxin [Spirochaetota bacterium]HOS33849.1 type II toxin-antitoxin system RelE/ParE family toxin [Spirochaetota bacterium]HOS56242.1 type II toxin-antitoxin system RelE/ParE family toxin [Spirochaetota bacterium]
MNYKIVFEASKEIEEAIEYYDLLNKGLGSKLLKELENSLKIICEYPESCVRISKKFRRCLLRRFPYGIIYTIYNNEIIITAFMNLYRKPNYWKNRSTEV